MPTQRFRVHQHLTITALARNGASVTIRVTDGNQERRIAFALDDLHTARQAEGQLSGWRANRQQLTYVRRGDDGVLLDEDQLFHEAYGDDLPELS
jgi:hypothetical protein